jgi:hypothetical protein
MENLMMQVVLIKINNKISLYFVYKLEKDSTFIHQKTQNLYLFLNVIMQV